MRFAVVLFVISSGCRSVSPPQMTPANNLSPSDVPSVPQRNSPVVVSVQPPLIADVVNIVPDQHLCTKLMQDYNALITQSRGARQPCVTEQDCTCYPLDIEIFCATRVFSRSNLAPLERLRQQYVQAGCRDMAAFCSPYLCDPVCVGHNCVPR